MKELVYGKSVTWMLKSMFVRTGRWWSGWGGLKLFPSGAFGWSLSPCINCRSARSCNESSQYHFPCFIPSRLCFLLFPGFVFFLSFFFFLCFLLERKINNLKALKVEVFNGDRADWFVWFFFSDGDWCVWFLFCRSSYFQLDYFMEKRKIEIWGWDRNFKLSMFRSFPRILWKLSTLIDAVQLICLTFNSKIFLIEMRGDCNFELTQVSSLTFRF